MEYKKNDIVRLNNRYFEEICAKLFYKENLFYIDDKSEDGKFVRLRNVRGSVPSSKVFPVRIDGVEDRCVFYNPVIAASIVPDGKALPSYCVDEEEYYIEPLKKCYDSDGRMYYDILQSKQLSYVHEIQHELPEIGDDLKIHYTMNMSRTL